ncbi:ABC transporter substrate-binding protein [Brucellaceae bacterium C25G]
MRLFLSSVSLFALSVCGAYAADGQDAANQALLEAAKSEPAMTVYAVTGKIVDTAQDFSKKYGLNVSGKKVNEAGQVELLIRENQAGSVMGSVSLGADVATIAAELEPKNIVETYLPEGLAEVLPEAARKPLAFVNDAHVWAYNGDVFKSCPVTNIWQLTDPEWSQLVSLMDPLEKPTYPDWFNQLETHHDAAMAEAYEAHYGKPFDAGQGTATEAWVKAFAANGPLVADSSGVSGAIGAPGQDKPFFGIVSVAKFRDNKDKNYSLTICPDMKPFSGLLYPGLAVVATGTKSPNTAKLFINYLMSQEGMAPQLADGKTPTDPRIQMPADEPSHISAMIGQMMPWNYASSSSDLDRRQDWQDIWRINYRR